MNILSILHIIFINIFQIKKFIIEITELISNKKCIYLKLVE